MSYIIIEDPNFKEFLKQNREGFQESLLNEAVHVRNKIKEIQLIGNIDLLNNAHKLVTFIVEQEEQNLIAFARQEGEIWAAHSLTLAFKLEWIQAIRRTLWDFLANFNLTNEKENDFYLMERQINDLLDEFLNEFFLSYSAYKDELLARQKDLVQHLSVPVIPISRTTCVLPLIGRLDSDRSEAIEEKIYNEIHSLDVQRLIIDLSGIAETEIDVMDRLSNILRGVALMGCKVVITGIRPLIVRQLVQAGLGIEGNVETKGTLQQALKDYQIID